MKKLHILLLLLLTSIYSVLFADSYHDGSQYYFGVGAGYGDIITPAANYYPSGTAVMILPAGSPPPSKTSGHFVYDINGGYLWNVDHFGIGAELSFNIFENVAYYNRATNPQNFLIQINTFNFMAVGKYYLPHDFSVALKAGGAFTLIQFSAPPSAANYSTNTMLQPTVGAGGAYVINNNIAVTLDGFYIFGDTNGDPGTDLRKPLMAILAGISYRI